MTSFVRGSTIFFDAACLDADATPITPTDATLYLVYLAADDAERTTESVPMTVAGNIVSAEWDSAIAKEGTVRYSIKATGLNKIVQDGEFTLTANEANAD